MITPDECPSFKPEKQKAPKKDCLKEQVEKCIELLKNFERPVLISGYGIRLAKGEKEFLQLIDKLGIHIISSWATSDLIPSLHELSIAKNNFGLERIYHCVYKDKYNDRYTVLQWQFLCGIP